MWDKPFSAEYQGLLFIWLFFCFYNKLASSNYGRFLDYPFHYIFLNHLVLLVKKYKGFLSIQENKNIAKFFALWPKKFEKYIQFSLKFTIYDVLLINILEKSWSFDSTSIYVRISPGEHLPILTNSFPFELIFSPLAYSANNKRWMVYKKGVVGLGVTFPLIRQTQQG